MTYKVFISYSWSDAFMRHALITAIKRLSNVEIFWDRQNIQVEEIHVKISDLISKCDAIVVLLTWNSLSSKEVLEELVRADERKKLIIPVVEIGIEINDLPQFLRDVNAIKFDSQDPDTMISEVTNFLSQQTPAPKPPEVDEDQDPSKKPLLQKIGELGLVDLALNRSQLSWNYAISLDNAVEGIEKLIWDVPKKGEIFIVARSLELWCNPGLLDLLS